MSTIDKINYKGTLLDIADAEARADVSDLRGALSEETYNLLTGPFFDGNGFAYNHGTITNTKTDTRDNFMLNITSYNGSTAIDTANMNVLSTGRKTLSLAITANANKLRIKHNGSAVDLQIFTDVTMTQGKTYTFSCDVNGYDPKVVGGISFTNIQFEEGATASPYTPPITAVDFIARGQAEKALINNDFYTTTDAVIRSELTPVSTTYTDGYIFEQAVDGAKTSDYIAVPHDKYQLYMLIYSGFSSYYDIVRFYDANHNQIGRIIGGIDLSQRYIPLKLMLPQNCKYIKYAQYASNITNDGAGLYKGYFTTFEASVHKAMSSVYTENNNVLWIGTSIPEGAQYPAKSCEANGYVCTNKSLGSSKLCFEGTYQSGSSVNKGKRLTATVAELESLYRIDVTNGVISEDTLTIWKNYSYENSIIPYIDGTNATQVSMIVLDHGFNDRGTIHEQMQDEGNIDWDSDDRSTFTGAFKYLVDHIQAVNPFIKIVVGGYFTNTVVTLGSENYFSDDICEILSLLAARYDMTVLDVWNHTQISNQFVSGTSDYLSDFNTEYGTSYTALVTDGSGNITSLQMYCPDGMHPHSDLTGNCNKRLNAVYTKLLAHMI